MDKPKKIQPQLQKHIDEAITKLLSGTSYQKYRNEVQGYIADVVRGHAHSKESMFTVPYWAFKPDYPKNRRTNGGYFLYYVAHELSHIIAVKIHGGKCFHDPNFYGVFMDICPKEYQHFELRYKKTAAKYGITEK